MIFSARMSETWASLWLLTCGETLAGPRWSRSWRCFKTTSATASTRPTSSSRTTSGRSSELTSAVRSINSRWVVHLFSWRLQYQRFSFPRLSLSLQHNIGADVNLNETHLNPCCHNQGSLLLTICRVLIKRTKICALPQADCSDHAIGAEIWIFLRKITGDFILWIYLNLNWIYQQNETQNIPENKSLGTHFFRIIVTKVGYFTDWNLHFDLNNFAGSLKTV